jgi:hypothetical protein
MWNLLLVRALPTWRASLRYRVRTVGPVRNNVWPFVQPWVAM